MLFQTMVKLYQTIGNDHPNYGDALPKNLMMLFQTMVKLYQTMLMSNLTSVMLYQTMFMLYRVMVMLC